MTTCSLQLRLFLFGLIAVFVQAQESERFQRFQNNRSRCFSPNDLTLPSNLPAITHDLLTQLLANVPDVCISFSFSFCSDSPSMHLNISSNGDVVVDQDLNEQSEICENRDISSGGCKSCIGIKQGALIIKPNYAKICPQYKMKCNVIGVEFEVDPEEGFKFPCYPFGEDCTASTQGTCLEKRGCGWCDGGGVGREYWDDTGSPSGKGCTPMVPQRPDTNREDPVFIPFCSNCDPDKFIVKNGKESSAEAAGEYIEAHPGTIAGITIGIALFIFAIVGIFVYCMVSRKRSAIAFSKLDNGPTTGSEPINMGDEKNIS